MRLRDLSLRVVAGLGVGAAGWAAAGGCGGPGTPKDTRPVWEKEDVQTLPMEPAWRKYAEDNYLGVVLSRLGTGGVPPDFVDKPSVIATRNRTRGTTELMAAGSVDVVRPGGTKYRQPYVVVWEQAGSDWRLVDARVEAGGEAPTPPPERIAGPASHPATAPAGTGVPAAPAVPPAAPPAAPGTP